MAVETRRVVQTFLFSDTTKDFTFTGFGTPDAAILFLTRVEDNFGRISEHHHQGVSLWDGTRVRSVSIWDGENFATTDSLTTASNDEVIMNSNSEGVLRCTISNITDGIRLTKVSSTIADVAVTVVLIKGTDSVRVDTFTPDDTNGNDVSVTAPGFQPDYLFTFSPGGSAFGSGVSSSITDALWAVAHVARDGSSFNLVSSSWGSDDGQTTSNVVARIHDSEFIARNVFASQQNLEFRSFDPTGFTIRSRGNRIGNRDVAYLAIKFQAGDKAKTFSSTVPSSTGNIDYQTPGVNPDSIMCLQTRVPQANIGSDITASDAESVGFYVCDSGGLEASSGGASEDGVGTSVTIDYHDSDEYIMYQPSSATVLWRSTHVSNGTEEFRMNWTDAGPSPQRCFIGVVFGADAVSGGSDEKSLYRGIGRGTQRGIA